MVCSEATHERPSRFLGALLHSSSLLLGALLTISHAQMTLDGSLGPLGPLAGPHYSIGADIGQLRGGNLFHSFGEFNVPTGGSATFTGPAGVVHILGRVTGGKPSSIDGVLRSKIDGANLYLLNPSGALLGPNARLEVSGAFHLSTADFLRFADGTTFHADLAQGSALTVAPPEAFGFLAPAPAAVSIRKSALEVPTAKALSIIGGDVHLAGGVLAAPGGELALVATQAPGEVNLSGKAIGGHMRGHLHLSDGGRVDVSGHAAGEIRLVGGHIDITAAEVTATTGAGDGRPITVNAESLSLSNSASLTSRTEGSGTAGEVTIQAREVVIQGGGRISSHTFGPGNAGSVTVEAEHLALIGTVSSRAGIFSLAEAGSHGNAGRVVVHADRLVIDGRETPELTGVGSLALSGSKGNAADTRVLARDIEVLNGGTIFSSTFGPGTGGTVTVQAERLLLAGVGASSIPTLNFDPTAIGSAAVTPATGAAGDIHVIAGTLELRSGGVISSTTHGRGNAGTIVVQAHRLLIDGGETPAFTAIASTAGIGPFAGGAFGDAGSIRVTAGELEIRGGGAITSATFGAGNAGPVVVQAHRLVITGIGTFVAPGAETPFPSRIESSAEPGATGAGGRVEITAHTLVLTDHGTVATRSFSPRGNAGDITLRVGETLDLRGSAVITTEATEADAGNLTLTAQRRVRLQDHSAITASVGGGAQTVGGNLSIQAPVVILEGSQIVANAFAGMGGNIRLDAGVFLADPASRVSASSTLGIQGTVDIQAPVTTLSETLAPLPQAFESVEALLPARCAARFSGGTTSSLVLSRREGLPPDPTSVLPSPLILGEQLTTDSAVVGELRPYQRSSGMLLTASEKTLPRLSRQPPQGVWSAFLPSACAK